MDMSTTMSWEEIISLVKAYYKAKMENDAETMVEICNVLPDYVKLD